MGILSEVHHVPMNTSPPAQPPAADPRAQGTAIVSSGWLAANSMFGSEDRRTKRAFGASLATVLLHVGFLLIAIMVVTYQVQSVPDEQPVPITHIVYLQQPGPGGGGGGSPAPAPPNPLEVPKTKAAPDPIPIVVPPPTPVPPPPPSLTAPITTNSSVAQASGTSSVSLSAYGGGGRGTGLGTGTGSGVGPGTGGGFGGGAYRPGAGITFPEPIKKPTPVYTAEAMRMKVTGSVELEAVVMPDGTVGDVRVTKSLDRAFGLDDAAIKAAKQWFFIPAKDRDGKAVPVVITLIFDLRLH